MPERVRLGYVKEYFRGMELRSWVADQDMESEDPTVQRDVQKWLHGISHPFTSHTVQYNIHPRLSSDDVKPDCPWVAEYTVRMYDQVYAIAISYGKTEEEAITNLKNMIKYYMGKYYIPVDETRPAYQFDEAKFLAELEAKHKEEEENNA